MLQVSPGALIYCVGIGGGDSRHLGPMCLLFLN